MNDKVISIVQEKQNVTAAQVREALTVAGKAADPKQVNNSLDYLTRRGQLERIGRGEYRINPAIAGGAGSMRPR